MTDLDLLERFRATTPEPDDVWLRRLRDRIADEPPFAPAAIARPRRHERRRRVLAAVAAVLTILVLAGSILLPTDSPTGPDSATARIDPKVASMFRRFAHTWALAPAEQPPSLGQYVYEKSIQSQTNLFLPGPGLEPFAFEVSGASERWVGLDGSGRSVHSVGQPRFLTNRDRQAYEAFLGTDQAEYWGGFDWGKTFEDRYGPGDLSEGLPDLSTLPTDPDELRVLLDDREIFGGPPGDWETFTLAADLLRIGYVSPELRAAIFEVLSELPGTELIGPIEDALGRPGVAVGYTHNGLRQEIVFGRKNGDVLAERQVSVVDRPDIGVGEPHEINTACCTEMAWSGLEAGTVLFSATYLVHGEVVDSVHVRSAR